MNTLQDNQEFAAIEKAFSAVQQKLVENRDRKAAVEVELTKPILESKESAFDIFQVGGIASEYGQSRHKELVEEYQFLEQQEKFLTEAAEQGRRKLDTLRGQLSHKVCEEHRAEYVEIAREIINALYALEKANAAEVAFIAKLQADSVQTGYIKRVLLQRLGSLKDENSFVSLYLKETLTNYPELQPTLRKTA